jgi:hypothetical protein
MDDIRDKIEGIVADYCDGTYNGLERAHFVETDKPQELVDRLVEYVKGAAEEVKWYENISQRLCKDHVRHPLVGWNCPICEVEKMRREVQQNAVDIKYLSTEVETLQAQLKREREASKNLLKGFRYWGERAGQESVPAFVVGLLAAFKEDRK